jgi:hypothetical protein
MIMVLAPHRKKSEVAKDRPAAVAEQVDDLADAESA